MPHPDDGEVVCLACRRGLNRTDRNCYACGSEKLDRSKVTAAPRTMTEEVLLQTFKDTAPASANKVRTGIQASGGRDVAMPDGCRCDLVCAICAAPLATSPVAGPADPHTARTWMPRGGPHQVLCPTCYRIVSANLPSTP